MNVLWPMLFAALTNTSPGTASLFDVSLALRGTTQANIPISTLQIGANGLWDTTSLFFPHPQQTYPAAFVLLGAEIELGRRVYAHGLLDSGELRPGSTLEPPLDTSLSANGQSLGAFAKSGAWLRELELVVHTEAFKLGVGKRRHTLGRGIVYDDYAWGLDALLRGEALTDLPWSAEAALLFLPLSLQAPSPVNPFAFVQVAYTPSLFESIEIFAAIFDDRAGSLNDVLSSAVAEELIINGAKTLQAQLSKLFLQTRQQLGTLGYLGANVDLLPRRGVHVSATAVVQRGTMHLTQAGDRDLTLDLRGWAADAMTTWEVVPYVELGLFGFAQSGSRAPSLATGTSSYASFLGVAPYLTYSNLFFSGGLNQGFFAGRATAAGFNGHGIAGAGVTASAGGLDGRVEARVVYLAALAAAPVLPVAGGGQTYGVEYDVTGVWPATRWLTLGAEADLLQPGSFFPQSTLAWRLVAQVYVYGGS